ncbi:hypothetical protein LEN26_000401 [Aphanomyces euteiches]|nr:hypothetical protein AeMF1_015797 [Aphanomyces euteiches]KAH9163662.1 hypothetical protein LEN26_000401 [Aphanomyces euteiches]KAH9187092.1 hypothetical protein AeNC1_010934 [Aphanomyces euteiches]
MSQAVEICMDTSLACDLYLYNDYEDLDDFERDLIAQLCAAKSDAKEVEIQQEGSFNCTRTVECPAAAAEAAAARAASEPKEDCGIRLDCSICLEKVKVPTATTCGHIYCRCCIIEALRVQKKCPLCSTKISFRNIHPIYFN